MRIKKYKGRVILCIILCFLLTSCGQKQAMQKEDSATQKDLVIEQETDTDSKIEKEEEQFAKGYNLPIDEAEKSEAKTDCMQMMEVVEEIYQQADKGKSANVIISEDVMEQMASSLGATGASVTLSTPYANMDHYEAADEFLKQAQAGQVCEFTLYKISSDGGIGREKYHFDGTDMYVLATKASWDEHDQPMIAYISYNRIQEWRYTDKGWFCFEMCVPEPPEVTEVVNGSCLIRVQPMEKEYRDLSQKYVLNIGYQGNNLLCSNWDSEHMEGLDYNALFQYFYFLKNGEKMDTNQYVDGIPKDLFETIIMEYLPVTAEEIEHDAKYDASTQKYNWQKQSCFNYAPTAFGTSIPEIIGKRENADGTITFTIDAVCDMMLCDETAITHELTMKIKPDGSYQYLGNQILGDGLSRIPDYQYR